MTDWENFNSERGECIVRKRKSLSYSQMLMILVLTFLGVKNGFDVFIYTSIILLLASMGLMFFAWKVIIRSE